jgi:uncharacterized protein with HEPN domain
MKSKHPDRIPEYLQHILDAINRVLGYVAAMNDESFNRDTRTQDAVIRSIQIIGEAANKVRTTDPGFARNIRRFRGLQCMGCATG